MANEEAGIAQMLILTSSLGLTALHTLQGCGDKHLLILMVELSILMGDKMHPTSGA